MHSFISVHVHCVWSTKNRKPSLNSGIRDRLLPYLGGIARENKIKALAIGGAEDHVHILLSVPATLSVAKVVQLLKGNSSKWIHETFSEMHSFEWQEGYGAFSLGVSAIDTTKVWPSAEALGYFQLSPTPIQYRRTNSFSENVADPSLGGTSTTTRRNTS